MPTEEEIMLQVDLQTMPGLGGSVLQRMGRRTTTLANGVTVFVDGPFNTNCSKRVTARFGARAGPASTSTRRTSTSGATELTKSGASETRSAKELRIAIEQEDRDEKSEATMVVTNEIDVILEAVEMLEYKSEINVQTAQDLQDEISKMREQVEVFKTKAVRSLNRAAIRELTECEQACESQEAGVESKEIADLVKQLREEKQCLLLATIELEGARLELESEKSIVAAMKRARVSDKSIIERLQQQLEGQLRDEHQQPDSGGASVHGDDESRDEESTGSGKDQAGKHQLAADGPYALGEVEALREARLKKRQERELARIASSGIDVDDFGKRRSERYDAEEQEADLRETQQLRRQVVWECERSQIVRERIRRAHAEDPESKAEPEFKRLQFAKDNGGIAAYLSYLNAQFYGAEHTWSL